MGARIAPLSEELVGRRIALVSVTIGLLLSVVKIWVGLAAGSAAVVSDGIEAGGDVLSSVIVYAGLWIASKPPDHEHPYGHGRYEILAGLAVGAILLLSAAAIFWHSVTSLSQPSAAMQPYALYPLIIAVVLKCALAAVKFRTGRRIASTSLQADAWHDITDLLSTSVALFVVVLTLVNPRRFGAADHLGGMLIGIIVFFLSIRVVLRTIDHLVDTMPEPAMMNQVYAAALRVPGAVAIEKCFARRTGLKYHVDLHLEVDPDMTVRESHAIAAAVKANVKDTVDWVADVLVHVEPVPDAVGLVSHR
jgi:cation diffusion facilitator family transporter